MKYVPLSKKRKKILLNEVATYFPTETEAWNFLKQSELFELIDKSRGFHYMLDDTQKVIFFLHEDQWLPSLHLLMKKQLNIPSTWIDEGAVRFVLNGADIFGQGITKKDDSIKQNDIVLVRNPQDTPLAIGIALVDGPNMTKGRVIKNIHRIGDKIYSFKR